MLEKLNPRRSPATVVAIVALIAALGGTAIAAGGFTAKQKKQVKKIATKVFNSNISGATVAHAGSADTAAKATTANTASKATTAPRLRPPRPIPRQNPAKRKNSAASARGLPAEDQRGLSPTGIARRNRKRR